MENYGEEKTTDMLEKRIKIDKLEPAAFKAMYGLEKYLNESDLSETHKDLLKIRASQINGCAFCIHMHTTDALKRGESKERIFLLQSYKTTDLFTEEEKTILRMTEEITMIHVDGLSADTYAEADKYFSENYIAQVIIAISTINAWNRIAISTHMPMT